MRQHVGQLVGALLLPPRIILRFVA